MFKLPQELYTQIIFSHMYPEDIQNLYKTCKYFNNIISKEKHYIYDICKHKTPHGEKIRYTKNIKAIIRYKEGLQHGIEEWYSKGNLISHCIWYEGKLHGKQYKWQLNGNPIYEMSWENGLLHGIYKEWHDNNKISCCLNYYHGMKIGNEIYYDRNGNTIYIIDNDFFDIYSAFKSFIRSKIYLQVIPYLIFLIYYIAIFFHNLE